MKDVRFAAMGLIWLALGLFLVFRPGSAQAIMDGHADWFKRGSWHPIRNLPLRLVRGLGGVVCLGAAFFFYMFAKSN
jgi:hypothetical protein